MGNETNEANDMNHTQQSEPSPGTTKISLLALAGIFSGVAVVVLQIGAGRTRMDEAHALARGHVAITGPTDVITQVGMNPLEVFGWVLIGVAVLLWVIALVAWLTAGLISGVIDGRLH